MPESTLRRCCNTPSKPQPNGAVAISSAYRGLTVLIAVGEDQAGLQQVQVAEELHLPPIEILPVEAGEHHVPVPEGALIGHVVDRQQAGQLLEAGDVSVFDLQVGGNQAGLPVVNVQQIDLQIEQPDRFEHRPTEEDEPLAVVAVVLIAGAVEMVAIEVLGLFDEIGRHVAAGNLPLQEPAGDRLATDRQIQFDAQPARAGIRLRAPADRPA